MIGLTIGSMSIKKMERDRIDHEGSRSNLRSVEINSLRLMPLSNVILYVDSITSELYLVMTSYHVNL